MMTRKDLVAGECHTINGYSQKEKSFEKLDSPGIEYRGKEAKENRDSHLKV